jgi:YVTN family beta-propeller protein
VVVFSAENLSVIATVPVPGSPNALGCGIPVGVTFVTSESGNLTAISDSRDSVLWVARTGAGPAGILYDTGLSDVLVTDTGSNTITVFSALSGRYLANVSDGGAGVYGLSYDPTEGLVFVTDTSSDQVTVLSASTFASVSTAPVGQLPVAVAFDNLTMEAFVANSLSNSVSIVGHASPANPTILILALGAVGALALAVLYLARRGRARERVRGNDGEDPPRQNLL